MHDTRYPVDILDRHGKIVDTKPRNELDKYTDAYHTVNIILITPHGELVLQTIPENKVLPNMYIGTLGTIAAIKRSGETAERAAERCMSRQLFIDNMPLIKLGGRMHDLIDGRRLFVSAFYGVADPPGSFSLFDIESLVVMNPQQLDALVAEDNPLEHVAVNLLTIWREYRDQFPV